MLIKLPSKAGLSKLLVVLILAIFAWFFFNNIEDFKSLLDIHPLYILALILLSAGGIISNGLFMKWSILLFDKDIKYAESIKVALISTAGNFFAPAGSGLGFRAVYLKKVHKLAYSDYIAVVFCNYILAFFINSILGLWALYELREHSTRSFMLLTCVFIGLLLMSITAIFIRIKPTKRRLPTLVKKLHEVLVRITYGWKMVFSDKKIMLALLVLMILNTTFAICGTYLIMNALNFNISLAALVLFSVIGSLSIFINITPGNLGIKEAIYLIFSSVIGLSAAEILSVAIVDRTVIFIVLFILWVIYGRKTSWKGDLRGSKEESNQ